MNCRSCGARLAPNDLVCGTCGAIVESMPPSITQPSTPLPRSTSTARRVSSTTLLIIVFACGLLALITASAVGGVAVGLRDREGDRQAQADKYFQEGVSNLGAGKLQLAKADFEYVLKIAPGYPGASEQLAQVQEQLTVKPTPTFAAIVSVTQQLFDAGQTAYQAKNWKTAIDVLSQMRSIDPTYQRQAVDDMIYNAATTYGLELFKDDRLEEGITYLEQAAYIRPLPADAAQQVQYARMYITARDYWNADWEEAIKQFQALYQVAPNYRDTFTRLVDAYLQFADERMRAGDPCAAQTQYEEASKLSPNATLQVKLDKAKQDCLTVPTTITGTNAVLNGLFAGRIAYPIFDSNGARILTASAGDPKLLTAALGDQPEWQRNGNRLAYRIAGTSANVVNNGSNVVIAPADAEFPTFSPDGTRVIYSLNGKLYMINSNGSGSPVEVGSGSAPTWGPKGWLAYSGCDGSGCGIMIRDPDNTDPPKRLTASPDDIPTSWSPDGFNISYYSDVSGNYDLYFVNTAGGVQQVTKNAANNVGGAWGPDGSHIAFLSDRDGGWALYLAKYDGSETTKIASAPQGDWTRERVTWVP